MKKPGKVKKMLIIGIIIIFVMTAFYQMASAEIISIEKNEMKFSQTGFKGTDHHTVLSEQGTATWCPHCPSMGYWLSQVQGDFVYIALVADMNGYASQRCNQLGLTGYPTSFFDGGYTSVVGGQSNVNNLQNAYDQCQDRTVSDLTVSVTATLDEDSEEIEAVVFIDNNEDTSFSGQLRVFVCEKESRWDDYDGDPYVNAMLGYTTNTAVTISASDSESRSGTFSFPDIEANNILIVAALYDSTDDYIQQVATTTPTESGGGGGPPVLSPVIAIKTPEEGGVINGNYEITGSAHHPLGDGKLKWTLVKIDDGDWITAEGTSDWSYTWDTKSVEDGTHKIRAVTSDGVLQSSIDLVTFQVNNYGNMPPYAPTIMDGASSGDAGYIYTFTAMAEDPNANKVKYGWDIDEDNVVDTWTDFFDSGVEAQAELSWANAGLYNLRVKAEDEFGEVGEFSTVFPVEITGQNSAPITPDVEGPNEGEPGVPYDFTANSQDPEGTQIWYFFDWGDGKDSGWRGPYESGESLELGHTYNEEDTTMEIRVKAKDIHNEESDWGTINIYIPRTKNKIYIGFLENYPALYHILQKIYNF